MDGLYLPRFAKKNGSRLPQSVPVDGFAGWDEALRDAVQCGDDRGAIGYRVMRLKKSVPASSGVLLNIAPSREGVQR